MPRKFRFRTISGSLYEVDRETKTWKLLHEGSDSTELRGLDGPYLEVSFVYPGMPAIIMGPPTPEGVKQHREMGWPGLPCRVISTSTVTELLVDGESESLLRDFQRFRGQNIPQA